MTVKKFIELRFGQGPWREGELVQREIVPTDSIINAFVNLPNERNIEIMYKVEDRVFHRTEYYRTKFECTARWNWLKKALGYSNNDIVKLPEPLGVDAEEKDAGWETITKQKEE